MKTQKFHLSNWVLLFSLLVFFGLMVSKPTALKAQSPEDAIFPSGKIILNHVPADRPYAAARCDIATLRNDGAKNDGYVILEYIKIIEEDIRTGERKDLLVERYAGRGGSILRDEGGLYTRKPKWFDDNQFSLLSNSYFRPEGLVINVGHEPNHISHLYTHWVKCRPNTRNLVELKLLVSGDIGFQIGLDYCNRELEDCSQVGTHYEAFVSNWVNDTRGEFKIFTFPDYDTQTLFDNSHYGVTTNGVFFISKELVDFLGGGAVELKGDATGWTPEEMHLLGDRYVLDKRFFPFQKTLYCFRLNKNDNFHVPAIKPEIFQNQSDLAPNSSGGFNFLTYPKEN